MVEKIWKLWQLLNYHQTIRTVLLMRKCSRDKLFLLNIKTLFAVTTWQGHLDIVFGTKGFINSLRKNTDIIYKSAFLP